MLTSDQDWPHFLLTELHVMTVDWIAAIRIDQKSKTSYAFFNLLLNCDGKRTNINKRGWDWPKLLNKSLISPWTDFKPLIEGILPVGVLRPVTLQHDRVPPDVKVAKVLAGVGEQQDRGRWDSLPDHLESSPKGWSPDGPILFSSRSWRLILSDLIGYLIGSNKAKDCSLER